MAYYFKLRRQPLNVEIQDFLVPLRLLSFLEFFLLVRQCRYVLNQLDLAVIFGEALDLLPIAYHAISLFLVERIDGVISIQTLFRNEHLHERLSHGLLGRWLLITFHSLQLGRHVVLIVRLIERHHLIVLILVSLLLSLIFYFQHRFILFDILLDFFHQLHVQQLTH